MSERNSIQFGETKISYLVLRSARRKKTIEITLDHQEGVLVAAPLETPSNRIADVVKKRAGWILRTASDPVLHPAPKRLVSGESLPYLGRQVRIFVEPADVKRIRVTLAHWSFKILVPNDISPDMRRQAVAKALERWYKKRAHARLRQAVARWAPIVGCNPIGVLVRNQRQRWGSCSPDGILRFNWRIIQVEANLIDYVVIHELVHMIVRHHSAQFWDGMGRVLPDFRLRRQRLKEAGSQLVL